jgi:phosphate acetyltransferase
MDFMQSIRAKAKTLNKTLVLPEGEEERTLRAAEIIIKEGIAKVILLGDSETMERKAEMLKLNLASATLITPTTSKFKADFTQEYYRLRSHKGITMEQAGDTMKQVLFFGAMLVRYGVADGSVGGAIHTTADVMRAGIQIIGMKPGIKIVSSTFEMVLTSGKVLTYSDCAVVPNPDAEQLASIAVSAADTHRALTDEIPMVAMLSFSTKGSAEHPDVDKVRQATEIAKKLRPELHIDGELQFDAAYVPAIGEKKSPGSPVAGKANVMVFPNLDAGNICYKSTQRLANARAIGPIVQGLNKPFFDLSRGCSAEDIVDTAAVNMVIAGSN